MATSDRYPELNGTPIAPQPGPQTWLLSCPYEEILTGGSRGGGKSYGLILDWQAHALRWGKNARGIIFRRSLKEFETLLMDAKSILLPLGWEFRAGALRFEHPNGATLVLAYLDEDKDADVYQGRNYSYIAVDEIGNFPNPEPINKVKACLRSATGVKVRFVASANPGGVGHCVPVGDVMTPKGWIAIEELKVGDPVYSVDQDGQLVKSKVGQVHAHHYEGDLWKADTRGLSITCTPEHRIAKMGGLKKRGQYNKVFSLVPVKDLPGQALVLRGADNNLGKEIKTFKVPEFKTRKRRLEQPKEISGDLYCELLGWVISEGYTVDRDKAFGISQIKGCGREKIERMLTECGFIFGDSGINYLIHAADWWHYLRRFKKCRDKFVPRRILSAPKRQLRIFFDALMDGDGHWRDNRQSGTYYTISKQLADDVCEIAIKLGYTVSMHKRQRQVRFGINYEVSFKPDRQTEILTGYHRYKVATETKRRSNVRLEPYSGMVYDIGIENTHTFIIRQNGTVWVSGNSWVKKRYIDPAPGGLKVHKCPMTGASLFFIPSKLADNKLLTLNDPNYANRLKGTGPPWLVKAWLEGDWNITVDGNVFKREWWKWYSKDTKPQYSQVIQSWDTAFKKKTRNDYSACITIGVSSNAYYVLNVWKGKLEFPELKKKCIELANAYSPHVVYIEDQASGQSLMQELRRKTTLAIKPCKTDVDKMARAYAVSPIVESGIVHLPEEEPWIHEFTEELAAYPVMDGVNVKHDDTVDAFTQALDKLSHRSQGLNIELKKNVARALKGLAIFQR
jgi:predicted phage terminase large subunit-like protein